jgi:hypothetical protein
MSTDIITSASTDDSYTLTPLMSFILTYKEDRAVEVPVLKDRAVKYRHTLYETMLALTEIPTLDRRQRPFNPSTVNHRQTVMMRLLAN